MRDMQGSAEECVANDTFCMSLICKTCPKCGLNKHSHNYWQDASITCSTLCISCCEFHAYVQARCNPWLCCRLAAGGDLLCNLESHMQAAIRHGLLAKHHCTSKVMCGWQLVLHCMRSWRQLLGTRDIQKLAGLRPVRKPQPFSQEKLNIKVRKALTPHARRGAAITRNGRTLLILNRTLLSERERERERVHR